MVEFKMNTAEKVADESVADLYKVNARDVFIPTQVLNLEIATYLLFDLYQMWHGFKRCSNYHFCRKIWYFWQQIILR